MTQQNKNTRKALRADIRLSVIAISCSLFFLTGASAYVSGRLLGMPGLIGVLLTIAALVAISIVLLVRIWGEALRNHVIILGRVGLLALVIVSGIAGQQVGARCFGQAFLHGYAARMRSRVDIESIRAWEEGLEFPPNVAGSEFIDESTWPESVRELSPNMVWLAVPPREGVELGWGSGHVGHWGVTVGPNGMQTPTGNEHRLMLSLADGAFVWYD